MAIMMPPIQPIGVAPINAPQLDYSPLFAGPGIMGGLVQGIQQGQQQAERRQTMDARQQQMEQREYAAAQQREKDRMDSLARGALELKGVPREQQLTLLQQRAERLADSGIDNSDTLEAINLFQQDPQTFDVLLKGSLDYGYRTGLFKTDAELAAAKNKSTYGAQQTFKDEKDNLFFGTQKRDAQGNVQTVMTPVTEGTEPQGQLKLVSGLGQTPYEKSLMAIEQAQQIAELKARIEKGSAADVEANKKLGALRTEIFTEETQGIRQARKEKASLQELKRALEGVQTGKYGQAKAFLGKYLPGVNVDNEQNLANLLMNYGVEKVRDFQGSTTDFEFEKSLQTNIDMGNTTGANKLILERMGRQIERAEKRYDALKQFQKKEKAAGRKEPHYENFEDFYMKVQDTAKPEGAVETAAGVPDGTSGGGGRYVAKNGWWIERAPQNTQAPGVQTDLDAPPGETTPLPQGAVEPAPGLAEGTLGGGGQYEVKNGFWYPVGYKKTPEQIQAEQRKRQQQRSQRKTR